MNDPRHLFRHATIIEWQFVCALAANALEKGHDGQEVAKMLRRALAAAREAKEAAHAGQ